MVVKLGLNCKNKKKLEWLTEHAVTKFKVIAQLSCCLSKQDTLYARFKGAQNQQSIIVQTQFKIKR